MSPKMFRELVKPYYRHVGEFLHGNNMHWKLHSCGSDSQVLSDLAEAGVDVFHPVQKGTMDEVAFTHDQGGALAFLVVVDVQHILQGVDPEGVRAEVRQMSKIHTKIRFHAFLHQRQADR